MNQRIPQFPSWNTPTQIISSQLASRPSTVQAQQDSSKHPSQSEKEREAFSEDRQEASRLRLKSDSGTLTSGEQERLGVLQAKMKNFWGQKRKKVARFSHNIANIPVNSPQQQNSTAQTQVGIQAKLTIGEPGDKYEQEADSVAAKVVNQINSPQFQQQEQAVQRQEELEEEELQTKSKITSLQRMEELEEEEELQAKFLQRKEASAGEEASMDLESGINSARGGGQPLDTGLQQSMGQAMGADFSGVRVHTDSQSDQLNQSIQARAFTTGQDVFFRQGEYNPGSRGGQELIAHELTHVVQQNGRTVRRSIEPQITKVERNIQKGSLSEKGGRVKRIIGRFFTKTLPEDVYRWDTREPKVIAQEGFQPRNLEGSIRLEEHVNNILDNGDVAKEESQWVSTGAYGMLKRLDPTFAQQVRNTNLYKINTTIAKQSGNFHDANDFFDKKGENRPYATQREWAKLGGIPPEAVEQWMSGEEFFQQYDLENGAPDESALTGWHDMIRE